jgi:hypothetical protein
MAVVCGGVADREAVAVFGVVADREAVAWRGLRWHGRNQKRERDAPEGRDPPGMPLCRFKRA